MQEVFKKIIKELRELKLKITAESRKVSETDNDCIFDKSDILDERAAGVADALKVVRRVLREYNNGWIPCGKRLPVGKEWEITDEDGDVYHKHVLCYTDNRDVPVSVAFYQEDVWLTADTYDTINVIAWQPLPAPYKPKED